MIDFHPMHSSDTSLPPSARMSWRGGLLLGWCIWLLGSWLVTMPYGPAAAVRWMMLAVMIGLMLLWPMLRLSLDQSGRYPRGMGPLAIALDWVGLALIVQAVIWPFIVTARWSLTQALWMNGAVLSWSLLIAALLAWGVGTTRAFGRMMVMFICVAIMLGEPLAMALWPQPGLTMRISPIQTIWELSQPGGLWRVHPWDEQVTFVAIAAACAWAVVLIAHRAVRARPAW